MEKHANLYYLFLDDEKKNQIPENRNAEIRKSIALYYNDLKPPLKTKDRPKKKIKDGF